MILSSKGALALLWEFFPGHPNLLACYFEGDPNARPLRRYARNLEAAYRQMWKRWCADPTAT